MGLFDTIRDRLFCPFCGKLQKEDSFQTKDLGKNMGDFTLEEIRKFKTRKWKDDTRIYTTCKFCNEWIEIVIKGNSKN